MRSVPRRRRLRRVLRYISRFGLRGGLGAARLHREHGALVRLQLPGIDAPLWARAGTSDVETFEEVFVERQYEIPFERLAPRRILDLGANVGYASVWFASRWGDADILAVEPAAGNIALLERNTEPWPRIARRQAAVWPRAAQVSVANPHDAANAFRMSEDASGADAVPGFTIADLMAQQGWDEIDVLKMDVEGAEAEILRGDTRWLDRVGIFVVELHDRIVPGCARALVAALHGRRFQCEIVGSNLAIDLR
jgi:FkbM family methyltransferase